MCGTLPLSRYTIDHEVQVQSAGWGIKRRRIYDAGKGPGKETYDTCRSICMPLPSFDISSMSYSRTAVCRTNQYGPSKFKLCNYMIAYYCDKSPIPEWDPRCDSFWIAAAKAARTNKNLTHFENFKVIKVKSRNSSTGAYVSSFLNRKVVDRLLLL